VDGAKACYNNVLTDENGYAEQMYPAGYDYSGMTITEIGFENISSHDVTVNRITYDKEYSISGDDEPAEDEFAVSNIRFELIDGAPYVCWDPASTTEAVTYNLQFQDSDGWYTWMRGWKRDPAIDILEPRYGTHNGARIQTVLNGEVVAETTNESLRMVCKDTTASSTLQGWVKEDPDDSTRQEFKVSGFTPNVWTWLVFQDSDGEGILGLYNPSDNSGTVNRIGRYMGDASLDSIYAEGYEFPDIALSADGNTLSYTTVYYGNFKLENQTPDSGEDEEITACPAVTDVKFVPFGTNGLHIQWTPGENAANYSLQYVLSLSADNGQTWTEVRSTAGTDWFMDHSIDLPAGTYNQVKIVVKDSAGKLEDFTYIGSISLTITDVAAQPLKMEAVPTGATNAYGETEYTIVIAGAPAKASMILGHRTANSNGAGSCDSDEKGNISENKWVKNLSETEFLLWQCTNISASGTTASMTRTIYGDWAVVQEKIAEENGDFVSALSFDNLMQLHLTANDPDGLYAGYSAALSADNGESWTDLGNLYNSGTSKYTVYFSHQELLPRGANSITFSKLRITANPVAGSSTAPAVYTTDCSVTITKGADLNPTASFAYDETSNNYSATISNLPSDIRSAMIYYSDNGGSGWSGHSVSISNGTATDSTSIPLASGYSYRLSMHGNIEGSNLTLTAAHYTHDWIPCMTGGDSDDLSALISEAENLGLLKYLDEDTLTAGEEITRLQTAMLMAAAMDLTADDARYECPYPDVEDLTDTEKALITVLEERNIIGGYSDGTFQPDNIITNAAIVKLAHIYLDFPVVPITKSNQVDPDSWVYVHYSMLDNLGILDNVDIETSDSAIIEDVLTIFIDAMKWRSENPTNPQYPVTNMAVGDAPFALIWDHPKEAGDLWFSYEVVFYGENGVMSHSCGGAQKLPLYALDGDHYTEVQIMTYAYDEILCGEASMDLDIDIWGSEEENEDAKVTFTENTDGTYTMSLSGLTPDTQWYMFFGKSSRDYGYGMGSGSDSNGCWTGILPDGPTDIVEMDGYCMLREYPYFEMDDAGAFQVQYVECGGWMQCSDWEDDDTVTGTFTLEQDYTGAYVVWSGFSADRYAYCFRDQDGNRVSNYYWTQTGADRSYSLNNALPLPESGPGTYDFVLYDIQNNARGNELGRIKNALEVTVDGEPADYEIGFNSSATGTHTLTWTNGVPEGAFYVCDWYHEDDLSDAGSAGTLGDSLTMNFSYNVTDGDRFDMRILTSYALDGQTLKVTTTPPSVTTYNDAGEDEEVPSEFELVPGDEQVVENTTFDHDITIYLDPASTLEERSQITFSGCTFNGNITVVGDRSGFVRFLDGCTFYEDCTLTVTEATEGAGQDMTFDDDFIKILFTDEAPLIYTGAVCNVICLNGTGVTVDDTDYLQEDFADYVGFYVATYYVDGEKTVYTEGIDEDASEFVVEAGDDQVYTDQIFDNDITIYLDPASTLEERSQITFSGCTFNGDINIIGDQSGFVRFVDSCDFYDGCQLTVMEANEGTAQDMTFDDDFIKILFTDEAPLIYTEAVCNVICMNGTGVTVDDTDYLWSDFNDCEGFYVATYYVDGEKTVHTEGLSEDSSENPDENEETTPPGDIFFVSDCVSEEDNLLTLSVWYMSDRSEGVMDIETENAEYYSYGFYSFVENDEGQYDLLAMDELYEEITADTTGWTYIGFTANSIHNDTVTIMDWVEGENWFEGIYFGDAVILDLRDEGDIVDSDVYGKEISSPSRLEEAVEIENLGFIGAWVYVIDGEIVFIAVDSVCSAE